MNFLDAALKAILVGRVIRDDLKCKELLESILKMNISEKWCGLSICVGKSLENYFQLIKDRNGRITSHIVKYQIT